MLIVLFAVLSFLDSTQSYQSWGHYTIVAPGTIRSNSDYYLSISLDEFSQSCWMNITLKASSFNSEKLITQVTVEVEPKTTELVKIRLPKLYYGYGILQVTGFRGIIFKETGQVTIEERDYTAFIQLDKSKYKPGEVVQFRVICIDRFTRPAEVEEVIDVYIYDGEKNVVRKFDEIKLVQGVFKGSVQLSRYLNLGTWVIEVKVGGTAMELVTFEVERYLLPKFSVQIDTRNDIAVQDGDIVVVVKSRYTYDQPVNGSLTIHLESVYATTECTPIAPVYEFHGEETVYLNLVSHFCIMLDSFYQPPSEIRPYELTATVTEALTGQSHSAQTMVRVHYQPYVFLVTAPEFFDSDKLVNITVSIKDHQGNLVKNKLNPIVVRVQPSGREQWRLMDDDGNYFSQYSSINMEYTALLNEAGLGAISLKMPNNWISEYEVTAEYLGFLSDFTTMKRNFFGDLSLVVLTERPEVGKELLIKLNSKHPIDYLNYEIVSRGYIIESQRITVANNTTSFTLSLKANHLMVPKITLYVHSVKNGQFRSKLKDIYVKHSYQSSIVINSEDEVRPGVSVSLDVTTNEESYVGLMGIDERLLLDPDYSTALTEDNIFYKLRNFDAINMDEKVYPGGEAGLITFSNARNKQGIVIGRPLPQPMASGALYPLPENLENPSINLPRMRNIFTESWLFNDFERTSTKSFKLDEVVPDAITTWAITGFSINPRTGFSLTRNATRLRVFQDFFVSMDMPSSAKEGEIIQVPVYVSNYKRQVLDTEVTLTNPRESVELLDDVALVSEVQANKTISKLISADGKEKFVFLLRPRKVGHYNITVKAISSVASDAIQKTLVVEPAGAPHTLRRNFFINLNSETSLYEKEIFLDIPATAIVNSERTRICIVGDVFGPLITDVQTMVRVPFGSSEDNIKYFILNLLVLKYLKATNLSNPSLESRAKLHLELGYQTQLSFQHLDGSFSRFDRTAERTGDIWMTAYTMWALQQAKAFVPIDSKVLERSLIFLQMKQEENGGFYATKGDEEDVHLSAFIVLTFLVDEESKNLYKDVIKKGLQFVCDTFESLTEAKSKAISIYTLIMGNHEQSEELKAKFINAFSSYKDRELSWNSQDQSLESHSKAEVYSVLAFLQSQEISLQALYPVLQTLLSVSNEQRMPSHMVALDAVIKLAHHINISSTSLNIQFENEHGEFGETSIDSSNSQLLQEVEMKSSTRHIRLRARGTGVALVSVRCYYNLAENITLSGYQTNLTIEDLTDHMAVFNVCIARLLMQTQSGLTVVELYLPSGYIAYEGSFERIKQNNDRIKSIVLTRGDQSLRLLIENIPTAGTCFQLSATKSFAVFDLKPISIVVYSTENEDARAVLFHDIIQEKR